ncbi:MAG: glycosyltransferase family 2 protein [Candidatus Harrisonbacteria bacterium]|nr:glycosyltransferase family 2 protein [Candidatus Harrisonbacteria bacterium]
MIKKLSVIIPLYNERENIKKILEAVEKAELGEIKKDIVVVDDGSTDGSYGIAKEFSQKYKILRHEQNRGKGAAIKTALPYLSGEYTIIQDSDLEYSPSDWPKLLAAINNGNVVYGSRNLKSTGRGYFFYFWGGRSLSWLVNILYGARLTDVNTGYKLFPTDLLKSLNLKSDGFEFCEEATAKVLKRNVPIKEIPISYRPRTFEEGKKIRFYDGLIAVYAIFKYYFTR